MDRFVGVESDGDKRRRGLAAEALVYGGEGGFLERGGVVAVALGVGGVAGFGEDGAEVAQGAPAFGVDGEAIDEGADVAAVLAFGAEAELIGAGVGEAGGFLLPARAQVGHDGGVAGLPVVAAEVIELEAGLVAFEVFAGEVEQRDHEAAHVGLVAPGQQREGGVAAFGFVELVVLVAGAVVDGVAVDELEVLADEVAPGVVDDGLGGLDVHAPGEEVVPGVGRRLDGARRRLGATIEK